MIPKFDNFFLPCLQCLSDDNIHNQESIRRYVIDFFKLSAAEVVAPIAASFKNSLLYPARQINCNLLRPLCI